MGLGRWAQWGQLGEMTVSNRDQCENNGRAGLMGINLDREYG
jgi:hypothetical protein